MAGCLAGMSALVGGAHMVIVLSMQDTKVSEVSLSEFRGPVGGISH